METKHCSKCGKTKPVSEFHKNRSEKDGLAYWCKECMNAHVRKYYQKEKIKRVQYSRQYRSKNPNNIYAYNRKYKEEHYSWTKEYSRAYAHKRRANILGVGGEFSLTQFDAIKTYYCPAGHCLHCGKQMELTADHVIPVVKNGSSNISNIQPICHSCNSRKHTKIIDYRPDEGSLRQVGRGEH